MTTTIAINCGCGFYVSNAKANELGTANKVILDNYNKATAVKALEVAQQHCAETGHTMEISGTVQNG